MTQKSLFTVTNVLFYFLHAILCPWTHNSFKKISIADLAIVAKDDLFWFSIVTSLQLICDVTRMRAAGIVTSYLSIVLARANMRKGDLHKWITTVNIDFSPPGIHGLACKKAYLCIYGLDELTCMIQIRLFFLIFVLDLNGLKEGWQG